MPLCFSIRDRSLLETDQSVRSRLVHKNICLRFSIHEKYSRESRYAGRSASIPSEIRGRNLIIKYGGHAMTNAESAQSFARDLALLQSIGLKVVVVHGGGPQIGSMLTDLGIESQFVNGYRMTDEPTMSVVRMVLVGKVNQDIVSRINGQGGRAIGLSGADGLLLKGHQVSVDGQDVGRVGIIDTVDVDQLNFLASGGYMPIIAPVAVDADGSPLNVNADLAAG